MLLEFIGHQLLLFFSGLADQNLSLWISWFPQPFIGLLVSRAIAVEWIKRQPGSEMEYSPTARGCSQAHHIG